MGYLDDLNSPAGLESASDEEVLAKSVESPAHFAVIVERYQEAFCRAVRRVLGNSPEVEDVVQEAFTKIYMNASRFKAVPGAKFSSWAYKILLNTSFSHYKRLKRTGEFMASVDEEILALVPDLSVDDLGKTSIRDEVATLISRLPANLARVLKLQFLEDKSQETIAKEEGITVSAVKTRVHRAKKELKKAADELGMVI